MLFTRPARDLYNTITLHLLFPNVCSFISVYACLFCLLCCILPKFTSCLSLAQALPSCLYLAQASPSCLSLWLRLHPLASLWLRLLAFAQSRRTFSHLGPRPLTGHVACHRLRSPLLTSRLILALTLGSDLLSRL